MHGDRIKCFLRVDEESVEIIVTMLDGFIKGIANLKVADVVSAYPSRNGPFLCGV